MVTWWPVRSFHPVTVKLAGALPGDAATQMVSSMWLTRVTRRGPSRMVAFPTTPADEAVPRATKAPSSTSNAMSASDTGVPRPCPCAGARRFGII